MNVRAAPSGGVLPKVGGQGTCGSDHPLVAQVLNNLAELYEAQGRYVDAELLACPSTAPILICLVRAG